MYNNTLESNLNDDAKGRKRDEFMSFYQSKFGTGKQRMAGDMLKEFASNTSGEFNRSNTDYRGDVRNKPKGGGVMSVLGLGQSSKSTPSGNSPKAVKPQSQSSSPAPKVTSSKSNTKSFRNDERWLQNQKTIANWDGMDGTSKANGSEYNAHLMSGVAYHRAVARNKEIEESYRRNGYDLDTDVSQKITPKKQSKSSSPAPTVARSGGISGWGGNGASLAHMSPSQLAEVTPGGGVAYGDFTPEQKPEPKRVARSGSISGWGRSSNGASLAHMSPAQLAEVTPT